MDPIQLLVKRLEDLTGQKVLLKEPNSSSLNCCIDGLDFFESAKKIKLFDLFVSFIWEALELDPNDSIQVVLINDRTKDVNLTTFAYYIPAVADENDYTTVYIGGRAFADVLRSFAHEMVHKKQKHEGRLQNMDSSEDNVYYNLELEDEANALAGRLVRAFGNQYKEIYDEASLCS